jgi:hypothetical protein
MRTAPSDNTEKGVGDNFSFWLHHLKNRNKGAIGRRKLTSTMVFEPKTRKTLVRSAKRADIS